MALDQTTHKFNCQSCGRCCTNLAVGSTKGFFLYFWELKKMWDLGRLHHVQVEIAPYINYMNPKTGVYYTTHYLLFHQTCPFREVGCQIYDRRPLTCRSFPLIPIPTSAKFMIDTRCPGHPNTFPPAKQFEAVYEIYGTHGIWAYKMALINQALKDKMEGLHGFRMVFGSPPSAQNLLDYLLTPMDRDGADGPITDTNIIWGILTLLRLPFHAVKDLARDWYAGHFDYHVLFQDIDWDYPPIFDMADLFNI